MNEINIDFSKGYELINEKLSDWVDTAIKMLPNFVVAVLILLAFVVLGKIIRSIFNKLFARVTDSQSLKALLSSIIYFCVLAIGTFIALTILKLDGAVTSLLAGAGVVGLALGFAFQEIASNFIAGTMMSVHKPFREGDLIKTNDYFGKVLKINLRTTEILTLQGQNVLVPNSQVFKNPITNYSKNGKRRVDLDVGVHYKTDLPFAKKLAIEAVQSIEGIKSEDVSAYYSEFGSSSINFTIRYWMPFTNKQYEYRAMCDAGVIAIKKAFNENGITIPFPMRTLDLGDVNFKEMFTTYRDTLGEGPSHENGSNSE